MWISDTWKEHEYQLLDTSGGERLERWGKYTLVRPDPQAIWNTPKKHPGWRKFDARYIRSHKG
ncbi:MAG: SAM-dependent methyltransferase, partial [Ruminococcaceae bacterium]|nr:SAM-dependent methyltransferase [Oscillospiraceae bacterium]